MHEAVLPHLSDIESSVKSRAPSYRTIKLPDHPDKRLFFLSRCLGDQAAADLVALDLVGALVDLGDLGVAHIFSTGYSFI